MKKDQTKLIIWGLVALVVGVLIGTFLVSPMTSGNAKRALSSINDKAVTKTKIFKVTNEFGESTIHVIKEKVVNESGVMPQLDDCCYFGVKTSNHASRVDPDGDPYEYWECAGPKCSAEK